MSATLYAARQRGPVILEKGRDNLISCPIYRDGVLVSPTSAGTCTVYNAAGTKVLDAGANTIVAGVATRTISSSLLADQSYSDNWRVEWALPMPDGVTHTFRAFGSLVYRQIYPPCADGDLVARHHDIPRRLAKAQLPSAQDYLDDAWGEIESRLVGAGKRPYLVADPSAFRSVHLNLTLSLIFADFATSPDSQDDGNEEKYRARYEVAWGELTFPQAELDGSTTGSRRRSARPTVWLCSRGG